ncbi:conserved hypothetical protein, secreted, partial [Candidatus Magnetobacterium bavaricum]
MSKVLNNQVFSKAAFLTMLCCILSLLSAPAYATTTIGTGNTGQYAWSENTGWFNFNPTNGTATFTYNGANSYLSGYIWSENIGWVQLAYNSSGPYTNTTSTNWGVNSNASGVLSGYGWSENAGWLMFNPTGGGVTISMTTGAFSGYAWGENIGYIHFSGNATDTTAYGVTNPNP